MQSHKNKKAFTIAVPSIQELMRKSSPLARQSYVRGNAAGIHGGSKPRYGKRDRQNNRRELSRAFSEEA
jgi:hypothetical protein